MFAQSEFKTRNIILITLDGFRWKEVFHVADPSLLQNKNFTDKRDKYDQLYWNNDVHARRQMLMPCIWETIAGQGQIMATGSMAAPDINVIEFIPEKSTPWKQLVS